MKQINITSPLSIKTSFSFPLQSETTRREVVIGALWLLVPLIGWILNMGHRIVFIHNMIHGRKAMPAWKDYGELFHHGLITFLGMLYYFLPSIFFGGLFLLWSSQWMLLLCCVLFIMATVLIPGYMSHYCVEFNAWEIFNVRRSIGHVFHAGRSYWHAWMIAIAALLLSFLGLIAFGIGFLFTSVWFWQVAGFSFASVMVQKHHLHRN